MGDVYRRSGRGGAGNFYSSKDIDEINRAKADDLEAQKPPPADDTPTDPASAPSLPSRTSSLTPAAKTTTDPPAYARSGRGGAGNFIDPLSAHPVSATSSSLPKPSARPFSGRGGAGNFTPTGDAAKDGADGDKVYDPEQEAKRKQALDADIFRDVRENLPQPPKIHYMHGPGRGRKDEVTDG
ncbi:hypothetical protein F5Y15DRAFT_42149 [Xylariaceae sp. FL0016]|nr:hypothetical protein F5Y15DRAFT_42149 [Xylariaceae sp. FL0016]